MNGSVALAADPLSVPGGWSCVDGRYYFEAVSTSSRSVPCSEIVLAFITERFCRRSICAKPRTGSSSVGSKTAAEIPRSLSAVAVDSPQRRVRLHLSYLLRVVRRLIGVRQKNIGHKLPQVVHHC
jgi:hypothetical protein